MAKDFATIMAEAVQVRDESIENANTALRVGTVMVDTLDAVALKGNVSDIVDALNSESVVAPLSANQGRILNDGKVNKTQSVIAGNGLTGGGALSGDVTMNVTATDDSLVVTADGIKVDTVDTLVSTSTTKPLSSKQGKVLKDGLDELELKAGDNQFLSYTKSKIEHLYDLKYFVKSCKITGAQAGYKYYISAIISTEAYPKHLYIDRVINDDFNTPAHVYDRNCTNDGFNIINVTFDGIVMELVLDWSVVPLNTSITYGQMRLYFSDGCYLENFSSYFLRDYATIFAKITAAGYNFKGLALPATNPGTALKGDCYIANINGTYSNFGNTVIFNEIVIFLYITSWSKIKVHESNDNIFLEDRLSKNYGKSDFVEFCNITNNASGYKYCISAINEPTKAVYFDRFIQDNKSDISHIGNFPITTNNITRITLQDGTIVDIKINWSVISASEFVSYSAIYLVFSKLCYDTELSNILLNSDKLFGLIHNYEDIIATTANLYAPYPENQISGLSTINPSFLPLKTQTTKQFWNWQSVDVVADTDSPFKGLLGYYSVINHSVIGTSFAWEAASGNYANASRTSRPTKMSCSFWTDKTDWSDQNVLSAISFASSNTKLNMQGYRIGELISKAINSLTQQITNTDFFSASCTAILGKEVGNWVQVIINFTNIVWYLAPNYKWMIGMSTNGTGANWIQTKICNYQFIEDGECPYGVVVIPDIIGSVIESPARLNDYGKVKNNVTVLLEDVDILSAQIDTLESLVGDPNNILILNLDNNASSSVRSSFNETYDIKIYFNINRTSTDTNNPCFNFLNVYLVNKITSIETIVHNCPDDITPAQYNGTYIGANHGCSDCRTCTVTGHGKTAEDVGSIWLNTRQYTLVGIIDENTLLLLGENTLTYPLWSMAEAGIGTFTHVSGATHTGNIVTSTSTVKQWYSSMIISNKKIIANGKELLTNGSYMFKRLQICENYDILNVASVLEKLQENVGFNVANPNPNSFTTADKTARHSIVYTFDKASDCKVSTNFTAYQNLTISYFGFMQQGPLVGSNVKMYIPKALPVMDGATEKDFRTIVQHNTVGATMNLTSEYWENPLLPPDRYIQSSENVVFNGGFLFDYGVGGNSRKDLVNNAFFLYTSRKVYPHGIDDKIVVTAGTNYSSVCFRIYSDVANFNQSGLINQNGFEYENKYYLYTDFNIEGYYDIDIDDKFVGKQITVLEKSSNVTLLSDIANSKILISVSDATPMYGYLVIQVK